MSAGRLLREADVGRLAVSIGDHVDIFPINHVVDGETVVFKTLDGTKLQRRGPRRAGRVQVDDYDPWTGDAWSVVVKGRAVEIDSEEAIRRVETLPLFAWWALPDARWVQIRAHDVSGRRFHVLAESQPAT